MEASSHPPTWLNSAAIAEPVKFMPPCGSRKPVVGWQETRSAWAHERLLACM